MRVQAGAGDDLVGGRVGSNTTIFGGSGNDRLSGLDKSVRMLAGEADDALIGSDENGTFEDCDPSLLCWSIRTVTSLPEPPGRAIPVRHIHGRLDRVIPAWLSRRTSS